MARDYANSKAPRRKKNPGAKKQEVGIASFIKLAVAVLVLVIVVGGLWYIKFQNKKNQSPSVEKTHQKTEIPIIDQRPKEDPYEYRKLLENTEIKTDNKKDKEIAIKKPIKTPELIIDMNHKESRQAEAERAQAILNGSLNTSQQDKVHTVKMGQDDKIIMVDGTTFKAQDNKVAKLTADQIEANPQYKRELNTQKKPSKSSLGASGQFLMQCGAFKSGEQALSLKQKLDAKGQKSRIISALVNNVTWHRVIIGPYVTKSMASDVLTKLKSDKVVSNCNVFLIK